MTSLRRAPIDVGRDGDCDLSFSREYKLFQKMSPCRGENNSTRKIRVCVSLCASSHLGTYCEKCSRNVRGFLKS